jgi:hypothetical protein
MSELFESILREAKKFPGKKEPVNHKPSHAGAGVGIESTVGGIVKKLMKGVVKPADVDALTSISLSPELSPYQKRTVHKLLDEMKTPEEIDPGYIKHIWNQWS